jgi:UDP-4-amino-4,6-dideoxy-N-acetyl-beta-L-altrosamine N-acetyltransferase
MNGIGRIHFCPILNVPEDDVEAVRVMRNHPEVRRYMYTDHQILEEEHRNWLNMLKSNQSTEVFVVYRDQQPLGVVSLSKISRQHATSDWAYYLDPEEQGGGVGVLVEYALLEYAFGAVRLQKLNCEVLATNPRVVNLHKKFGFKEEGVRRSNIVKDGQRIDVHLLGETFDEWEEGKLKFKKIVDRYDR